MMDTRTHSSSLVKTKPERQTLWRRRRGADRLHSFRCFVWTQCGVDMLSSKYCSQRVLHVQTWKGNHHYSTMQSTCWEAVVRWCAWIPLFIWALPPSISQKQTQIKTQEKKTVVLFFSLINTLFKKLFFLLVFKSFWNRKRNKSSLSLPQSLIISGAFMS